MLFQLTQEFPELHYAYVYERSTSFMPTIQRTVYLVKKVANEEFNKKNYNKFYMKKLLLYAPLHVYLGAIFPILGNIFSSHKAMVEFFQVCFREQYLL